MFDALKYKNYEGTAELDLARGICRGKRFFYELIIFITHPVPTWD
jgi:hypothetical protein